ncbi:unnamed protein product [Musa acuminata subsp. burmannicoides]
MLQLWPVLWPWPWPAPPSRRTPPRTSWTPTTRPGRPSALAPCRGTTTSPRTRRTTPTSASATASSCTPAGLTGRTSSGAPAPTSPQPTPSTAGSARSSTTTTTATRAQTARSAATTRRWCGRTRRPSAVLGCNATAAPSSSSATTTQRATSWGSALTETTPSYLLLTYIYKFACEIRPEYVCCVL